MQTHESTPRYTKEQVERRQHTAVGILALIAAGATVTVGVNHLEKANNWTEIDQEQTTVGAGENPTMLVNEAANEMAEEHNLDPNEISNRTYAAQVAADELPSNQPGESIVVTLEKNDNGKYRVVAESVNPVSETE